MNVHPQNMTAYELLSYEFWGDSKLLGIAVPAGRAELCLRAQR